VSASSNVIDVSPSPTDVLPLEVIVPAKAIELGAEAVNPFEKVVALKLSSPICKVPVFKKDVAEVMVFVVPESTRLYGFAVVTKDPDDNPPEKETFAPLVVLDIVVAFTT
jgi:hypothetical protein